MQVRATCRAALPALASVLLLACGGGGGSGGPSPAGPGNGSAPAPAPAPPPSPTAGMLPPAPFQLTATTELPLVGWQQVHPDGQALLVSLAADKAELTWSAEQKTYLVALADMGSGRLVRTFADPNSPAFSLIRADGSQASVYLSLFLETASMGRFLWQTAEGVAPFARGEAYFGLPVGSLPSTGKKVFVTDNSPQSALVVDFPARTVSGTITTAYSDAWGPYNNKVQAVLDSAKLQEDGTFAGKIAVSGAPRQGELRGRLFGPQANDLGVYWDGPAKGGYDDSGWTDWRTVQGYVACASCTP